MTQLPDWLHLCKSVDTLRNKDVLYLEGVTGPLERGKMYYIEVSYGNLSNSQTVVKSSKMCVQHSESQHSHNDDLEDWEKQRQDIRRLHSEITDLARLNFSDESGRLQPLRDTFTIVVKDDIRGEQAATVDADEAAESESTHGSCLKDRVRTRATVIIDEDFYKMTVENRVSLLQHFCRHLHLSAQLVQLLPRENEGPLIDADCLVAGPGDTTAPTPGYAGVVVQWDVGCSAVLTNQIPALQTLERTIEDGSLRSAIGRGVIGWHITKKTQLQERMKRQIERLSVLHTGTIVQIHPAPTARPLQSTTILKNQQLSASEGPGLRPSVPQVSLAFSSRRLSDIARKRARQSGKSGMSKKLISKKGLVKIFLPPFATPTVASVKPTRVVHVGTKVIEEELSSSVDEEDSKESWISGGFTLEPSKPYVASKFPEATASLPIFHSRLSTATSFEARVTAMTTSYTSIYAPTTAIDTEPFEHVVRIYSESLPLTTFLPESPSPLPGIADTTYSVKKYSQIEKDQVPDKSTPESAWDGEEQPLVTSVAVETIITGEATTRSGGQVDWISSWDKVEKRTSSVKRQQGYEFTSSKPAKYRKQENLNDGRTKTPRKTKTVDLSQTALSTITKVSSTGTKSSELKAIGSSEWKTTFIDLYSTVVDRELPAWTTPKSTTPLMLHGFGGRRRVTTFLSTVTTTKTPITLLPSTDALRNDKISKHLKYKKTTRTPKKRKTYAPNYAPVVLHELGNLDVFVGSVFRFRIPNDTFLDEDGPTDKLRLLLLTYDTSSWPDDPADFDRINTLTTVPPTSWIKLNSSTQLLYGLPTDELFGSHEYWLAAIDTKERLTKTQFEIRVHRRASEEAVSLNHEFFVILRLNYEIVIKEVDTRIDIVRRIASAFRDRNTDHVTVTGIRRGSVEFYWTNNTVVQESPCPAKTLAALRDHIISPDGFPVQTFVEAMHPYRLDSVGFVPLGGCLSSFTRPHFRDQPMRPVTITTASDEEVRKKPKETDDGNFLLYILIPMVGLAAGLLLLLVLCIVCHGCRQRKKTRDTKGIPVIFTEEMAADRPPSHSPRPVLADEVTSPFMMPPTYSQSLPGSRFSTMRSNYKPSDDDDSSSGLSSDAEQFSPRSIGQSFPGWPPSCGPPPPYIAPYQPRYA